MYLKFYYRNQSWENLLANFKLKKKKLYTRYMIAALTFLPIYCCYNLFVRKSWCIWRTTKPFQTLTPTKSWNSMSRSVRLLKFIVSFSIWIHYFPVYDFNDFCFYFNFVFTWYILIPFIRNDSCFCLW